MKETKELKRFKCSYMNCNRILMREGSRSFHCHLCGHGSMKLVTPRAYCIRCEDPIFDNIDLRPDKKSKDGYYVFCGNCTTAKVQGIERKEEALNEKTM